MTRIVVTLFVLLVSSQLAFGQCGTIRYYAPTYQQPYVEEKVVEVVTPIAVPVIVPASVFQYLPALAPAVPVAAGGVAAPQVAQPQVSQPQTAQTKDIDKLIDEKLEAWFAKRMSAVPADPTDAGPPALVLPPELKLEPRETKDSPPVQETGDINTRVANMLGGKSCVRCHTAGEDKPVKGNITLFSKKDGKLFFSPSISKQKLVAAVTPDKNGKSAMPPEGPVLSETERDLLRQWLLQK